MSESAEFWWVRYADSTEPAEVHFRDEEPVEAWLTGNETPVRFPHFELVMRIPGPPSTPPSKDMRE